MNEANHTSPHTPSGEDFWLEAETLAQALAGQLDYFESLGVRDLPASYFSSMPRSPKAPAAAKQAGHQVPENRAERDQTPAAAIRSDKKRTGDEADPPAVWAPKAKSMEELSELSAKCSACPLSPQRSPEPPLMGQGGKKPLIVVIGPTPAIFQGDQWALLSAIMEKGLDLTSEEYYASCLLKCGPTDGQAPPPSADACCWPILRQQLMLLSPQIVLILGKKPAQQITGLHGEPLGLLRPRTHYLEGLEAFIRVTYGLEDINSDPELKKAAWQDLKKIKIGLQKIKTRSHGE